MTENDNIIEGTVDAIAFGGKGIIRTEGFVVFVPRAAVGDHVRVCITQRKKRFAFGHIVEILKPSPNRNEPLCPHFKSCDGCQLQHLAYDQQINAKKQFIIDAFERIGKIPVNFPVEILEAKSEWGYRRHITLTLKNGQIGYTGEKSGSFVPIRECPIFGTDLTEVQKLCRELNGSGRLQIFKTENEKLICHFHFPDSIPKNFRKATENLSWLKGAVAQAPSKRVQIGKTDCSCEVLGLKIHYTPECFCQNHPEVSVAIYRHIEQMVKDLQPTNILDLYSGIGITTLLFARLKIPSIGVEISPHSVKAAIHNAEINAISNASFVQDDAAHSIDQIKEIDSCFLNPPRTGADKKVLEALVKQGPAHVLYMSCMPSTLARDSNYLVNNGYRIVSCKSFDMFPQTTHVETVVLLERN